MQHFIAITLRDWGRIKLLLIQPQQSPFYPTEGGREASQEGVCSLYGNVMQGAGRVVTNHYHTTIGNHAGIACLLSCD